MRSERSFSTLSYYRDTYANLKPALAFEATNLDMWRSWHEQLQVKLVELLGGFPKERVPLNATTISRVEEEKFVREHIVFDSEPGVSVPAYLLIPRSLQHGSPARAVLCLHGHGRGKDDVVGLVGSLRQRQERIRCYNYDYGRQFAGRGFVVLAPDARVFGERAADGMNCTWAAVAGLLLGKVLVGMRVWDAVRALDYLQSRQEVAPDRIACVGLSWGALHTTYTAALDERVKVAVVSGFFSTFKDHLIDAHNCPCQCVPNLLRYVELADIDALIAPRPLFIESGTEDPYFTIETLREEFVKVQRAYDLLGVPERVRLHTYQAWHRFSGAPAIDWVDEHL